MSAPKLLNQWGVLGGIEPSYNGALVLSAATHGLLAVERVKPTPEYAHDGSRNGSGPGTGGQWKKVKKSGRSGKAQFTSEAQGSGTGNVYNGTTILPSLHTWLRTCGHSATLDVSGGAGNAKLVYAPISTGLVSGAFEMYSMGQMERLSAAYGTMGFSFEGPVVPAWNFEYQGLLSLPVDVALPAITYPNVAVDPAKAESVVLTLNGWAGGVIKSCSFTQGLPFTARLNDNSTGHAGFSYGRRQPKLEITLEAVPLTTFDPYALEDAQTAFAVSFQVGTVQFRRWKFSAANAQVSVQEEEDGPTALWHLTLDLAPSSPTADDDYAVTFD
jgi:hypothetical protein